MVAGQPHRPPSGAARRVATWRDAAERLRPQPCRLAATSTQLIGSMNPGVSPPSGRAADWWLAAAFFVLGTIVGSAYVRAFDASKARTNDFAQAEFGAAVA